MTQPAAPLGDALQRLLARQADAYDPWADLAERTGVQLAWHVRGSHEDHPGAIGLTTYSSLTISFLVGLTEVEMRSTLTHELLHLERGPVTLGRTPREEEIVSDIAAKRLVDPALFDALIAVNDDPDRAQITTALRVDRATFKCYRRWRSTVQARTAHRVWQQARNATITWPPTWLEAKADEYDLAARWAGLA